MGLCGSTITRSIIIHHHRGRPAAHTGGKKKEPSAGARGQISTPPIYEIDPTPRHADSLYGWAACASANKQAGYHNCLHGLPFLVRWSASD